MRNSNLADEGRAGTSSPTDDNNNNIGMPIVFLRVSYLLIVLVILRSHLSLEGTRRAAVTQMAIGIIRYVSFFLLVFFTY